MTLSDHLRLLETHEAERTATKVLETLEGLPFVVVGGWAVYAHGSNLQSVDIDVWYDSSHHDAIYGAFLEQHGVQLDTEQGCERFNLDLAYLDDTAPLFGTDLSYKRSDLRTETAQLLGHTVQIPTGPDLLFSKAKAFHDRSQQWEIKQNAERLAALRLQDPDEAGFIDARSETYWLRKAGKDLADVRYLESLGFTMGGPQALREPLLERLTRPHPILTDWIDR